MSKSGIFDFLKVVFVIFLVACTIIPNAGIWNVRTVPEAREIVDGFVTFWSIADLFAEGVIIYLFSTKVLFKKKEAK